ncbi:MAG: helix-turn-helix domain-containing protein, partial [Cellulosilyticaceae bacterium]
RACRQDNRIKELEEEVHKLKNENSIAKNARGAGRKSLLSDKKDEIKRLRAEGIKIKELAERYNCSTGLIHKLINE